MLSDEQKADLELWLTELGLHPRAALLEHVLADLMRAEKSKDDEQEGEWNAIKHIAKLEEVIRNLKEKLVIAEKERDNAKEAIRLTADAIQKHYHDKSFFENMKISALEKERNEAREEASKYDKYMGAAIRREENCRARLSALEAAAREMLDDSHLWDLVPDTQVYLREKLYKISVLLAAGPEKGREGQ
jgi:chromosome segregation ATPase